LYNSYFLKKVKIWSVESAFGPRAPSKVVGIFSRSISSEYCRHSVRICWTVNSVPHVIQIGFSSFDMRWPWVNRVCPMRSRFIITLSLLFVRKLGQLKMELLIFLNLVVCSSQYVCHLILVSSFIWFFMSTNVVIFNMGISVCSTAFLASWSAFSLPSMSLVFAE